VTCAIAPLPHFAIVAENQPDGVVIELSNLPSEAVSVRLIREDLGRSGDLSARTSDIRVAGTSDRTLQILLTDEASNVTFMDYEARPGYAYRYIAAMQTRIGGEFLVEAEEPFVRIIPVKPLPVAVSLENLKIENLDFGALPSVSFDIVAASRGDKVNDILRLLEQDGVSQIFIDQVTSNRSRFEDLIKFLVERVDRQGGSRESFGFYSAGTFTDDRSSQDTHAVSPVLHNNRYTYFVKVCMVSPLAFFTDVYVDYSTTASPGITDKRALAQKFLSAYSNVFANSPGGALPSVSDLVAGISPEGVWATAETGIVLTIDAMIPTDAPKPVDFQMTWHDSGTAVNYSWALGGGAGGRVVVDRTILWININGVTSTAYNTAWEYYDGYDTRSLFRQVGTTTCWVTYVYTDGSKSPPSNTVTHYIDSDAASAFEVSTVEGDAND